MLDWRMGSVEFNMSVKHAEATVQTSGLWRMGNMNHMMPAGNNKSSSRRQPEHQTIDNTQLRKVEHEHFEIRTRNPRMSNNMKVTNQTCGAFATHRITAPSYDIVLRIKAVIDVIDITL